MIQSRPAGQVAPAMKYDLLTAMMTLGLHDAGPDGRLAQRLALLVTARYSWRTGAFAVGLREIARLWGVTERTAKREMALLRARGWIAVRRPAARGRVAEYRIDLGRVLQASRPHWAAIGPDFVARMAAGPNETPATNVVPLRSAPAGQGAPSDDGTLWSAASRSIHATDPALHAAWFAGLVEIGREGARLDLAAATPFAANYIRTHFAGRLLAAISALDPAITEVRVRADR